MSEPSNENENLNPPPEAPSAVVSLTVHKDGKLQIWTRGGMSGLEFADLLRKIADQFENNDVKRIDA